jgi:FkbM family methyltransferase
MSLSNNGSTDTGETMIFAGDDLLKWSPIHSTKVERRGDCVVVSDADKADWHLIRIADPDLCFRRLHLRIIIRPLADADANLYVHHFGNIDVVEIDRAGNIANPGIAQSVQVTRLPDGFLDVSLIFANRHQTLSIGTSKNDPRYAGSSRDQFEIRAIEVTLLERIAIGSGVLDEDRICLVDVGGAGGLQAKWLKHADLLSPVLFEPNKAEAAKLRGFISTFPGGKVVEAALADSASTKMLNLTHYYGCTSLLEPNVEFLRNYRIAPAFRVADRVAVECIRYDELHAQGLVPVPDVIKIDVQGFEYEVLNGFGTLLENCLAVELEAHFYPIYKGQKLIGDLATFLYSKGLILRRISPVPNFDDHLVEVDAIFARPWHNKDALEPRVRRKVDLVTNVLGITA